MGEIRGPPRESPLSLGPSVRRVAFRAHLKEPIDHHRRGPKGLMFSRGCGVSAIRYRDLGTEQEKEQGEKVLSKENNRKVEWKIRKKRAKQPCEAGAGRFILLHSSFPLEGATPSSGKPDVICFDTTPFLLGRLTLELMAWAICCRLYLVYYVLWYNQSFVVLLDAL
ncbi:unnamed protein product [Spodoptera exigua]|nr:unnamed protein product [Spodoptera exigua]